MRGIEGQRIGVAAACAVALGLVASTVVGAEPAPAPQPTPSRGAHMAATWLAAQTDDGIFRYSGNPDWGFTTDAAFGYASAGVGDSLGAETLNALQTNAGSILSGGATPVSAGLTAKLALTAAIYGQDATDFGGVDLVSTLDSLMVTTGANTGLYSDDANPEPAWPSSFTQSYAVLASSRLGSGSDVAADFLVTQQCPDGGFRMTAGAEPCLDSSESDVDLTALAVQALTAASNAGVGDTDSVSNSVSMGTLYLANVQNDDGSFDSSGSWGETNTNTTGLAVQTLRAAGANGPADRGTEWLLSMQLVCSVAEPSRGAFPYGRGAFDAAIAAGAIPTGEEDMYRRATAQAVFGLGGPTLATLSSADRDIVGEPVDCSTVTTTTTSTTTTAPGETTTSSTTSTVADSTTTTSTTVAVTSSTSTPNSGSNADSTARNTLGPVVAGTTATRARRGLAVTGGSSMPIVGLALGLVALGAATTAASMRVRSQSR